MARGRCGLTETGMRGITLVENVEIRPARAEELPRELLILADPSPALVESYIHGGHGLLAEHQGTTVGVAVLLDTRPHTMELVNLAVRESLQGRGIGQALLHESLAYARVHGARTVEVGTGNSSIGQLALYQKAGFRIVGVERDFFTRHYPEPIYENGILCRDMIRLSINWD